MKLNFKKGEKLLTLPMSCMESVADADANDLRVLLYAASVFSRDEEIDTAVAAEELAMSEGDVKSSIKFWCGAGVIKKGKAIKEKEEPKAEEPKVDEPKASKSRRAAITKTDVSFTAKEICEIANVNGEFKALIDMAQQTAGWIFNTKDIEVIAELYSNLMLSTEYILALIGYFVRKREKPLRYLIRVANDYIENGIDTAAALEEKLQWLERFDGRAGKVRSMFGMGARDFSKKEMEFLAKWFDEFKVSDEMLKEAYDITVNNTGKASFSYINKILENWHKDGIKTPSDLNKGGSKTAKPQKKTTRAGTATARSFDVDDALSKALQRSYNGENK